MELWKEVYIKLLKQHKTPESGTMSLLPIGPAPIFPYLQLLCTTAKQLLPIHHLTLHKEGQQKVEESPLGVWTSAPLSPTHQSCLILRVEEPGRMDTRKSMGRNNHHKGKKY